MAICSRCKVSSRDSTALVMKAATLRNTTGKPIEIVSSTRISSDTRMCEG